MSEEDESKLKLNANLTIKNTLNKTTQNHTKRFQRRSIGFFQNKKEKRRTTFIFKRYH